MHTRFGAGLLGGLIGGIFYGIFLQLMRAPGLDGGSVPMIKLVGYLWESQSALASWPFHFLVSAVMGILFGLLVRHEVKPAAGMVWGLIFGVAVCLVFAFPMFPLAYGMPPYGFFGDSRFVTVAFALFVGHLLFGVVLGAVYAKARSVWGAKAKDYVENRGSERRRSGAA